LFGAGDAVVVAGGIDVDDGGGFAVDGLEAADEAVAFVSADGDDADVGE
jgi:hypothetical protein